jgi:flagellar hook protein FlgE
MLDVVANNIANVNTTAFKSQRVLFSDLLYETIRPAASASSGDAGGTNPNQVGSGVKVGQIDRKFSQGNLEPTGGLFDFAIDGGGLFVLDDGSRNIYSRAGAFGQDQGGVLVDLATGNRVSRLGSIGEPDGVNPGFQTPGNPEIQIPFGAVIPGEGTTDVQLQGNLNATMTGPLAGVLTSAAPYESGGAPAAAGTLLNALDSNAVAYTAGDTILINGTDVDGSIVSTSLPVNAGSTFGDLATAISGAFAGATANIDASGNLVLQADNAGPEALSLTLSDDPANSGGMNFVNHAQLSTTTGKDGDIIDRPIRVFDIQGGEHTINLQFQKQGGKVWDLTASMNPTEGTFIDDSVQQIQFNDDGSLQQVLGTGLGDANIVLQINGVTAPQSIQLSFGTNGSFDGLTQMKTDSFLTTEQNGFAPGTLVSVSITDDGVIEGVATNGRTVPIAQLAIASFSNMKGLTTIGDNYFEQSLNSGAPQLGTAKSGDRGTVIGGQLESSNVDIAFEFTRLIVAQRGFSANARTITVSDEILEELTNIIR